MFSSSALSFILSPSFYWLFSVHESCLLVEPGSVAECPAWPAVLSNLASRRDQRLATFHPKCPLPPSLHLSFILSLFLSLSPPPSPAWASLCIPPSLILFPLSSSLSLSPSCCIPITLTLLPLLSPHLSNYMPYLNNASYITPSLILFTLSPFHPSIALLRPRICSSSMHSSSGAVNPPLPRSLHAAIPGYNNSCSEERMKAGEINFYYSRSASSLTSLLHSLGKSGILSTCRHFVPLTSSAFISSPPDKSLLCYMFLEYLLIVTSYASSLSSKLRFVF